MKVLVIADDFTGALDTGVMFSLYGANTLVKRTPSDPYSSIPDFIDVVVVNTNSRHMSSEESYNVVEKIITEGIKKGFTTIYKKIDSALRGNVVPEIKAIMNTVNQKPVPLIPAFPEMNRVVKDGILYVDNLPVNESVFKNDPYHPVAESNIVKLIQNESELKIDLIQSKDDLEQLSDEEIDLLLFDSQTAEDMQEIGYELSKRNLLNVTVGCASFAKALSSELFKERKLSDQTANIHRKKKIIISGSVNPITQIQIETAEEHGVTRIRLTPNQLFTKGYWDSIEGKKDVEVYTEYILSNQSIMFETFSNLTNENFNQQLERYDVESNQVREEIIESLGELTKKLFKIVNNHIFMFIGGDTLDKVMEKNQVNELYPLRELQSGTVLSRLIWNGVEYPIISKSGGFGSKDLLLKI